MLSLNWWYGHYFQPQENFQAFHYESHIKHSTAKAIHLRQYWSDHSNLWFSGFFSTVRCKQWSERQVRGVQTVHMSLVKELHSGTITPTPVRTIAIWGPEILRIYLGMIPKKYGAVLAVALWSKLRKRWWVNTSTSNSWTNHAHPVIRSKWYSYLS